MRVWPSNGWWSSRSTLIDMQEYPKLISLQVVKTALHIADTDTAADDLIDRVIGWFSNEFQRRAGQPIAAYPVVYPFAGCWDSSVPGLLIPYWPIKAITAIRSRETGFGSAWEDGDIADVELVQRNGVYLLYGRNGFYGRSYEVTLTVGYDDVPGEVQRITLEAVLLWLKGTDIAGIGKGRLGLKSVTESDSRTGITKVTSLVESHPDWQEVIQQYSCGEYV